MVKTDGSIDFEVAVSSETKNESEEKVDEGRVAKSLADLNVADACVAQSDIATKSLPETSQASEIAPCETPELEAKDSPGAQCVNPSGSVSTSALAREAKSGGQASSSTLLSLSRLRHINPLTVALGLILGLIGAGFGFHHYTHSMPLSFAEGLKQVDIVVRKGETPNAIAQKIEASGIELSALAFKTALRVYGAPANIHAGRYRFEEGMTLKDVVERFSNGLVAHGKLRIPDGMNFRQLKMLVDGHEDVLHKTREMTGEEILQAIGAKEKHPEGLFSPDTYKFKTGVTDLSVYAKAYEKQMKTLSVEWELRAPKLKLKTPYEALILASIIEKETGIHTDRYLVSSVFHNRLRIWMPLQTDPTVIYGMGEAFTGRLRKRDLQRPGPYNSYINYGLPPTPIAMPSAASIHAALHPSASKYLYFVARGDGTTVFSRTIDEHNVAVNKYQKKRKRKKTQ